MPFGLGYLLAFCLGGVVFRYFEEILEIIYRMREDLSELRDGKRH